MGEILASFGGFSAEKVFWFFCKKCLTFFMRCDIMQKLSAHAAIAQPVERILGKDEVASSNLASSSKGTPNPSGCGVLFWFLDRNWRPHPLLPKANFNPEVVKGSHKACFVGRRWPVKIWPGGPALPVADEAGPPVVQRSARDEGGYAEDIRRVTANRKAAYRRQRRPPYTADRLEDHACTVDAFGVAGGS